MTFTVKITGVDELKKKMQVLTDDTKVHGRLVKGPLTKAIQVTHDAIDQRIPVDTGYLKSTHKISKVTKRRGEWIVTDGVSSPGGDQALAQEFGNAKTRAQPYILPGFQQSAQRAIEVFRSELERNIDSWARTGKTTEQLEAAAARKAFRASFVGPKKPRKRKAK